MTEGGREGMRCPHCGERHGDWDKIGERYVGDGNQAAGRVVAVECARCGGRDEVVHP